MCDCYFLGVVCMGMLHSMTDWMWRADDADGQRKQQRNIGESNHS